MIGRPSPMQPLMDGWAVTTCELNKDINKMLQKVRKDERMTPTLEDIKYIASVYPIYRDALLLARDVAGDIRITIRGSYDLNYCKHCYGSQGRKGKIDHTPNCPYIRAKFIMERLRELAR